MENEFIWQKRYNIGVDIIDSEHKKLFSIMNRLFNYKKQTGKSRWVCEEGIKYFKEHAMKHFTEEESYMASIGYMEFETHRRLHDNFRTKILPALERELEKTRYSEEAINHFLGVCAGWLIGHTLTEDRAIAGKTLSKWGDLLPEEEQAAMKQTIIHLLQDLFQLNSKIVSECYGGEQFGKGIYYRLVYATKQEEDWEILLGFEEKLIQHTIGSLVDMETKALNVLMVNAVRYTAQQFVNRINELFPSADLHEMKEENLLTYTQFKKIIEKENLQFSFLFNTGEGYFTYSVIAPHLCDKGIGRTIRPENAMAEIEEYLNEEEESSQKKKILVVDDSGLMRQAVKQLLEKDYEVSEAQPGMAAIQCITRDRPDLVLLDYEMPVCDGRQVLEMIRSEKEIADIAVIFLTGRMDRESVEKILDLKPAGYLLKTLQPAEIKKGVDEYFQKTGGK